MTGSNDAGSPNGPRYFRFVPMFGGHAGDSDELVCHVLWHTSEELVALLRTCGAELRPLPDGYQPPQPGVPVTAHTIWPLHGAPGYCNLHWVTVAGIRVGVSTRVMEEVSALELALFGADGDDWAVGPGDWANASIVEAELVARGVRLRRGDWRGRAIEGGPESWPRR